MRKQLFVGASPGLPCHDSFVRINYTAEPPCTAEPVLLSRPRDAAARTMDYPPTIHALPDVQGVSGRGNYPHRCARGTVSGGVSERINPDRAELITTSSHYTKG